MYHYEHNIYHETQTLYQNQHESGNGPKCDPIRETLECKVFLYVCARARNMDPIVGPKCDLEKLLNGGFFCMCALS